MRAFHLNFICSPVLIVGSGSRFSSADQHEGISVDFYPGEGLNLQHRGRQRTPDDSHLQNKQTKIFKKDDSHEQHRRGATSCPCSTGSPLPSPPPTVLAQLAGCTRQRYGEVTADSYLARWHQHLDEKDNDKDNDNDNGGLYKAAIWRGDCW